MFKKGLVKEKYSEKECSGLNPMYVIEIEKVKILK